MTQSVKNYHSTNTTINTVNLYYVLHIMLAQKGANIIKIVSVAIGLLVSTLVFARLEYNYSYDSCFPNRDRLYQVWMSYEINGQQLGPFVYCPGKIAEGAVEALGNNIEAATAIGRTIQPDLYKGNEHIDVRIIGADSTFFQTMGLEVLRGNPQKDLATPNVIYISESLANQLYGNEDPIGKNLTLDHEKTLTVYGIFRDLPRNVTVYGFKALISQTTYPEYREQQYWSGGDSWPIYFRMKRDSRLSESEINSLLNQMYQSHVPDTSEKTIITAKPINRTYLERDSVKRMNLILWVLGSALLLMTTLNYVLVTIATLAHRAKAIGIHKCIGAGNMTIISLFMCETAIILLCSMVLMVIFLYIFEPIITETLSLPIHELFASDRLWIPIAVIIFFIVVGGLLPGRIFSRIPVAQVFRRFTERNSGWKQSLLFVQICGVAFVSSLLVTATMQYREVTGRHMGFTTDRLAKISIPSDLAPDVLKTTIENLPYVEAIATSSSNPLSGYSGEMVYNDKGDAIFNTRTDRIGKGYIGLMGIRLLQGHEPEKDDEVVISEEFARKMGHPDNPVGQYIRLGNGDGTPYKIVGLVKDYILEGFTNEISPIVLRKADITVGSATIRLKAPFEQNYVQLKSFLEESMPQYDFNTENMSKRAIALYSDVRIFRNSTLIATVALIFISLMGLVGFSRDEVQRRSKEIAIRKVNGAEATDIIYLIISDIARIAIPAITAGILCAVYVGHLWLSNFSVTAPHIGLWYLLTGLTILTLVGVCILAVTLKVANENPVARLKTE